MTDITARAERSIDALRHGEASLAVWGCGHIGASAMYHFSRRGVRCVGYDIASTRVADIARGRFLSTDRMVVESTDTEHVPVRATTNWQEVAPEMPVVHVVSVPTERGAEPSSAALEDVFPLVCQTVRARQDTGLIPLISIESTIQPTWIDTVVIPTLHAHGLRPGVDVLIGAAPRRDWFSGGEHTLETLPRIVGGSSPEATAMMVDLYSLVCGQIVRARDAYHAAFTKVIENLIRFQGLALANSLSLAFPQYDMTHVLKLASTKWNIPLYHPSMGIGGHCIPLAPRYALAEGGWENEHLLPVRQAVEFNDGFFRRLYAERLRELLGNCRSIAVLGLAYTADAKMHKLSPAIDAIDCLRDTPRLRLHDPYYSAEEIEDLCGVASLTFPDDLSSCDGIVLVTGHSDYRREHIDRHIRAGTVIVDNFGIWRERNLPPGVRYYEIGRPQDVDSRLGVSFPEPAATESA